MLFENRQDAGRKLAVKLRHLKDDEDVVVLGLPRGGVPVAYEVARAIGAPLDVFMVRKLGVPIMPELAMGAIASGGIRIINEEVVSYFRLSKQQLQQIIQREEDELRRRETLYRRGRERKELRGKKVLLIDDGLATGATMLAAVAAIKLQQPKQIIVAVPIAPQDSCLTLSREVDETICLDTPTSFQSVGSWYLDFSQTSDQEVHSLLGRANQRSAVIDSNRVFDRSSR